MFKKSTVYFLFFIVISTQSYAQSQQNLKEINAVWNQFYQAFDSLDYTLMANIHSKKLVRIAGGKRIMDYDGYINNYKKRFANAKENKISNSISLRFFERINNDSIASDRGIYKLIVTKNTELPNTYYGKFHVLFTKENGVWKIIMDYDSNEGNSIDENAFNRAFGINENISKSGILTVESDTQKTSRVATVTEQKIRDEINSKYAIAVSKCTNKIDVVTNFKGKKEFWNICKITNGGRILRIESHDETNLYEEVYFEQNNALIYAEETIKNMPMNHYIQGIWNCQFYLNNGKLVSMMSLGHGKTESDEWNPEIIIEMHKNRIAQLNTIKKE